MDRLSRRIVGIIVGVALLTVFGPAALANAATTSKPYSLTICAGDMAATSGSSVTCSPAPAATLPTYETPFSGVVASGETVGITATFTNETGTQQLGSANLYAPGFTVVSATLPSGSPGSASPTTNCSVNGIIAASCATLRNLSLPPNASVTVTMSVMTPACLKQRAWSAEVKQANNFSGPPGNDLFLDTANSQSSTALDDACYLTFTQEPADAQTGAPISGKAYTPETLGGPALAVQVLDENMTPVTTSTVPVTMSTGLSPFGAKLSGTIEQPAVAGTASFSNLSLGLPSLGCDPPGYVAGCYTLVATSGQLGGTPSSPATSTPFNIQDQAASCSPNTSCATTDPVSGANSSTLVANASKGAGQLVESASSGTYGQQTLGLCGPSYASADPYVYESAYTPNSASDEDRGEVDTITFTPLTTSNLTGNPQQVLKAQQICFGDTKQFTTASGSPAVAMTLPNGATSCKLGGPNGLVCSSTLYVGLLPTCTGSTVGPCHNRQLDTTVPDKRAKSGYDIVLVDDVPALWADDPYRM